MNHGLSIDPGVSSGACLFSWDSIQPFRREAVWQFTDGAEGLARFLDGERVVSDSRTSHQSMRGIRLDALIVEKFTPRQSPNFSLTERSVEPLRCEGVLIGRGFGSTINWQPPAAQYFMGGDGPASRKRNSRSFLADHGLRLTGKSVGQGDADDAISATLHAIAFMRKIRHAPTLVSMFASVGA